MGVYLRTSQIRRPPLTGDRFYYVITVHLVSWIYAWVVQSKFTREDPDLDWTSKDFTLGFFVILLWSILPLPSTRIRD
jgi:hypothetical protein